MNLPDSNESSAASRLAAARLKQWRQQGEALLTIENARSFLNAAGLVLFARRPQIAAPAPSFVEAVIGGTGATPTPMQIAQAREMLARLVAEGLAVPLNLLGVGSVIGEAGDAPDFVVSAQVFSYIFSLRGDKAWKQPPAATGAARFSNLAIAAHEALMQRGPMTAFDLVTELGKEVTEGAVLRALGELWTHLRVLPLLQPNSSATRWELASTRLIKQMKAGANAGLPTALSALISLYLGQAIVASEDEVESFLSPLAARSRIRDVVHALVAARQLDTVAIEGKTMLYVAGTELAFLEAEPGAAAGEQGTAAPSDADSSRPATPVDEIAAAEDEERGRIEQQEGSRIAKFVPRQRSGARDLAKARPAKFDRKPVGEQRRPFGDKKPFAARGDRSARPPRDAKSSRSFGDRGDFRRTERGEASRGDRRPRSGEEGKPRFEKRRFPPRDAESRPRFEKREREAGRPDRERRPFVRREGVDDRPPRRPLDRAKGGDRPYRKPFERAGREPAGSKPFGRTSRFGPKREFGSRDEAGKRGAKPGSFGGPKPFRKRDDASEGNKRAPRQFGERKPFAKRGGFGKPFGGREHSAGTESPGAETGGRRFGSRPGGGPFGAGKFRDERPGGAKFGPKKFGAKKFGAKKFDGARKFAGKKFGAKKSFGKPNGPKAKPSPGESET